MKSSNKPRLLVSFSGGRTSAYMLWWLFNEWPERDNWEIIVVFANTGKEAPETLAFVDECAQEWGIDIVWVEGYPSDEGKGWAVIPKVVTYETAARDGEPFEAMISRLGIPSTEAPFCSDQLKTSAIKAYLTSIGWGNDYWKALGMRFDEPTRVRADWQEARIFYPLAHDHPTTRAFILAWWSRQSFDLQVHLDEGNCVCCWKKQFTVLYRIAQRKPAHFDWWQRMTDTYGHLNPRNTDLKPPFNFYRGNINPNQIIHLANSGGIQASLFDSDMSCGESCEPFK